ncbi:unnamed protein product [Linum trigynum]|uniref:Uncharacterized protein n=1 Tax=Linum trigynum TaxID=586398 RepID=A0AAV2GM08_9ROSI
MRMILLLVLCIILLLVLEWTILTIRSILSLASSVLLKKLYTTKEGVSRFYQRSADEDGKRRSGRKGEEICLKYLQLLYPNNFVKVPEYSHYDVTDKHPVTGRDMFFECKFSINRGFLLVCPRSSRSSF